MVEIKKIGYPEIQQFLDSSDVLGASSRWADFLARHYQAEPYFLGVYEGLVLRFILPAFRVTGFYRRLESVPHLYTEFVQVGDHEKSAPLDEMLTFLGHSKGFDSVKLHFSPIIYSTSGTTEAFKGTKPRRLAHVLKLDGKTRDELLGVMHPKTRYNIGLAARKGSFDFRLTAEIEPFFKLYLKNMKRVEAIPKSLDYFTDLKSCFGPNFLILSACHGSKMVAANLALVRNKYIHLAFIVSDQEYFREQVGSFIQWRTIEYCLDNGLTILDMGPATVSDYSHHRFKEGFGAKPVPIYDIEYYDSLGCRFYDFTKTKFRNLRLRFK